MAFLFPSEGSGMNAGLFFRYFADDNGAVCVLYHK
jgi:hypothetical protein